MVPIIMLHHVSDDPRLDSLKPFCIRQKSFLLLLDYLEEKKYFTVTFKDLAKGLKPAKNSSKQIILTFDDCPKELLDFATPELNKRNMKAVFYMPTKYIGGFNEWNIAEKGAKVELMNRNDLLQLNHAGMEIGSHSHEHVKLGEMNNAGMFKEQVDVSKKILEDILDDQVISFAYPYGSVPREYRLTLQNAGYKYGVSIFQKFNNQMALRRIMYHDGDSRSSIEKKLSVYYKWYRMISDPFKKY